MDEFEVFDVKPFVSRLLGKVETRPFFVTMLSYLQSCYYTFIISFIYCSAFEIIKGWAIGLDLWIKFTKLCLWINSQNFYRNFLKGTLLYV